MNASPFRLLAPEIRLSIYELLLVHNDRILLPTDSLPYTTVEASLPPFLMCLVPSQPGKLHLDLLQVCKEIRAESLPIFYGKNIFLCLTTKNHGWFRKDSSNHIPQIGNLLKWLNTIGSSNAALCKRIYMFAGCVPLTRKKETAKLNWQAARAIEKGMLSDTGLNQTCLYDLFIAHFWDEDPDDIECEFDDDFLMTNWETVVPVCDPEFVAETSLFTACKSNLALEISFHCAHHCAHLCGIVRNADRLLRSILNAGENMQGLFEDLSYDMEMDKFLEWPKKCKHTSASTGLQGLDDQKPTAKEK